MRELGSDERPDNTGRASPLAPQRKVREKRRGRPAAGEHTPIITAKADMIETEVRIADDEFRPEGFIQATVRIGAETALLGDGLSNRIPEILLGTSEAEGDTKDQISTESPIGAERKGVVLEIRCA